MKKILLTMSTIALFLLSIFPSFATNIQKVNYNYIKPITIKLNSPLIDSLITNGWNPSVVTKKFGNYDSYIEGYDIFFNKGLKMSTTQSCNENYITCDANVNKIISLVFDKKYNENIINSINMKSTKDKIIATLGNPQFFDASNGIFGYKGQKFYIFFVMKDNKLNQISIYRRDTNYDNKTLSEIFAGLNKEKVIYANDVYDKLIKKWNDFDVNGTIRDTLHVEYFSKGLIFDSGDEDDSSAGPFITVTGNFEGYLTNNLSLPNKINDLGKFNSKFIKLELDRDLIFEQETNRVETEKVIQNYKKNQKNSASDQYLYIDESPNKSKLVVQNDNGADGLYDSITPRHIWFLSAKNDMPDFGFNIWGAIEKFQWVNNRYFICLSDEGCSYLLTCYDTVKRIPVNVGKNDLLFGIDLSKVKISKGLIIYKDDNGKQQQIKYYFDKNQELKFINK